MFSKVFGSVEVMSALILGVATLGAAALNLIQEARKAKRAAKESGPQPGRLRRPLIVLTLALIVAGAGFFYASESLQANANTFARRVLPITGHRLINNRADSATTETSAPRPIAAAPAAAPVKTSEKSSGKLEDWLQSEGTKVYYRYTRYLPDACPGNPIAIGNWAEGESRPVPVRCLDGGWIALDLGPLVQEGRIVPNMTYCVNFRATNGAWGVHVPENAPGIDSVAVPAVRVPLGRAIGVRYLPGNPRERVVPTSDTPRVPC
ncbi:MAG TPA: hypothetical protein VGD27_17340 [Longimicrobiales bacterium]